MARRISTPTAPPNAHLSGQWEQGVWNSRPVYRCACGEAFTYRVWYCALCRDHHPWNKRHQRS